MLENSEKVKVKSEKVNAHWKPNNKRNETDSCKTVNLYKRVNFEKNLLEQNFNGFSVQVKVGTISSALDE